MGSATDREKLGEVAFKGPGQLHADVQHWWWSLQRRPSVHVVRCARAQALRYERGQRQRGLPMII